MKISACLIVKNEEDNIERCIKSFENVADEIIVVDTGSEDNTVKLVKKLGAKVFNYKWNDDFASARNYALEKSKYDWIIFLDADEYFDKDASSNAKSIIEKIDKEPKYDCINSRLINIDLATKTEQEKITVIRIFRNNKNVRYFNKIHESLKNINGNTIVSLTGFEDKLQIIHTGYSKGIIEKKGLRNLKLLLKELETSESKEMIYFYLVNSYTSCKDYDNAIKYANLFINSGKIIKNYETYIPQQLLLSMLKRGDSAEAVLEETNKYILKYPKNHAFVNIAASIFKSQKKYDKALQYYLKTIDYKKNFIGNEYYCEITTNEDIYYYIGIIYELKNNIEKAIQYYINALKENKKNNALLRLLILIRQGQSEEIIYLLNEIYDINDKKDMECLVDELSSLKYGKVLVYYHNIWISKFKEEDSSVIFTLIGNGNYKEAFKVLFNCINEEKKDWIEKFLVITALLSKDEENIKKIKYIVSEFYRKAIDGYLGNNENILFEETERNSYIDLISEFILVSQTNNDLEKLIEIKYGFENNISNDIGDALKKWNVYDWALEEYSEFFEDKNNISNEKIANCYFNAGTCCYYLQDYNYAIDLFEKAIKAGYKEWDINEYLNWIIECNNDENICHRAFEVLNPISNFKTNKTS